MNDGSDKCGGIQMDSLIAPEARVLAPMELTWHLCQKMRFARGKTIRCKPEVL
jgi:hypothetical protein